MAMGEFARPDQDGYSELSLFQDQIIDTYDQNYGWQAEVVKRIEHSLLDLIRERRIDGEVLIVQLRNWLSGERLDANIFAWCLTDKGPEIANALDQWDSHAAPFTFLAEYLPIEDFRRFLSFVYTCLKVEKNPDDFDNFHPERATEVTGNRSKSDPGIVWFR